MKLSSLVIILHLFAFQWACGQTDASSTISWLSFNDLDHALKNNPQRVLLYFYTDWCTYCRKMEKEVFKKQDVVEVLKNLHAVKINAETRDTIFFDGGKYVNRHPKNKNMPLHELAEALALRNGQFTPPVMLLLDEEFSVINFSHQYMSSKRLIEFIEKSH